MRAIVPKEILEMLWENKEKSFYFSWTNDGSFVYSNFWESLLGIGKERRGWLSELLPCCYADGVTYGVPWFSKSVQKVYFLIITEDCHWILAELHIRSGVITFYDSLAPESDVEDQKWWLAMRQCYADQIPKLLVQTEVMEKKNIDPTNYSISYRYAVNVLRQGNGLGDCRIWVMRNLYRLVNNLSLKVSNLTQAGLTYQERLTDFF
ncbi:ulp1 protease family, C-terminal catalytic domain-containing protein [Tanacetum coccineum]